MSLLPLAIHFVLVCGAMASEPQVAGPSHTLRVDALNRPLGLDAAQPRFSWQLTDRRQGARQTAYRLVVATRADRLTEGRADVWDSGKVASDQSVGVVYGGPALQPRQRYYWRVRVWDAAGVSTAYSTPSWWETGLMLPEGQWRAPWIAAPDTAGPLPIFRTAFTVHKPVARARVYATALGAYRLSLNGARVGRDLLTPDWTDYRTRLTYQTYDVTDLLRRGENALGAKLGPGWYGGPLGGDLARFSYGPPPLRLLLALHLTYRDGTESVVRSDETWRTTPGPILSSELYSGETYDARREPIGWNRPGFDARAWTPVRVLPPVAISVTGQRSPTIQATETLIPRSRASPEPGVYLYDLGQNMVGWARLKVRGSAGTVVQLRFAEVLDSTGTRISTANLRKAQATDTYTLKGKGDEVYEPHFTYHGFRYVELTGYPGTPPADAIRGIVVHTAAPFTARFTTSDSLVNHLWRNIRWSQRGNLHSVPTDCPQRDERLGWTGDAQVFWRTAAYNMDMLAFTWKWTADLRDAQTAAGCYPDFAPRLASASADPWCGGAGWADAGVIVPWTAYRHYGDTAVINQNWAAMERYLAMLRDSNPTSIAKGPRRSGWGDWHPAGRAPATTLTAPALIATAYWAYDAALMAEMARATGRGADAAGYAAVGDSIRTAFAAAYVGADGSVGHPFTNRDSVRSDVTQTALALALHFGLIPGHLRRLTVARLVREIEANGWHLSTGFLGTPVLLPALSEHGRDDVAYRLLFQETFPSWAYLIGRGATTMWETWSDDRRSVPPDGTTSYNHYAFGAVGEWLYRYVAGIDTDPSGPGFKKIRIHPRPHPRLRQVRGEYDSAYGTIVSAWTLGSDGRFTLTAALPPNTSGTIVLPNGETHEVGAGTYRFVVNLRP